VKSTQALKRSESAGKRPQQAAFKQKKTRKKTRSAKPGKQLLKMDVPHGLSVSGRIATLSFYRLKNMLRTSLERSFPRPKPKT